MRRSGFSKIFFGASIILCLGAVTVGATSSMLTEGRICQGVRIEGVDIGGCTREEAMSRLKEVVQKREAHPTTYSLGARTWQASFRDLGGRIEIYRAVESALRVGREGSLFQRWSDRFASARGQQDIPLVVSHDSGRIRAFLKTLAKKVDRPARRASLKEGGNGLEIVPESIGRKLDVAATTEMTLKEVESDSKKPIPLQMMEDRPDLVASDLAGIDTVLASHTTGFRVSERARTHNLTLAARQIHGRILRPGEIFSYNQAVGPRLKSLGFREAKIFVNGEVTPGTGGGICQVSSTLYNAALLTGMKIVARSHHSKPVIYVLKGRDATVAYGGIDFKFQNTASHPVYIGSYVSGGRLTIRILGHARDKKDVRIVSTGSKSIPNRVITRPDPSLPAGKRVVDKKGQSGYRVTTIRIVRDGNGSERREVISNDYYRPLPTVVRTGTRPAQTEEEKEDRDTPESGETSGEAAHTGGNLASD